MNAQSRSSFPLAAELYFVCESRVPFDRMPFHGIFAAVLAMFDRENNLGEDATARHWDWLITQQGANGLVIEGSSGEFIALDFAERLQLFRLAQDGVRNRVPVIYGSGPNSTKLTIRLSEAAQKFGADALIVILPFYQKPPKSAVLEHYRQVLRAVNLPIMLYNNPHNSACVDLSPQEIARLVDENVLHMVKSTFGTVEPVHDLISMAGDRMAIFYDSFLAAYEGLTVGAHGWISGILNVVTRAAKAMYEAVVHHDARKGFRKWKKILPIVYLYTYQQVGPVSDLGICRSMLKFWGLKGGYCRDPFFSLDEKQDRTLRDLLERSGWSPQNA